MTNLADQLRDIALGLERGDAFVMTAARRCREIADQVMRLESRRQADLSQKAHLMCANMPGTQPAKATRQEPFGFETEADELPDHWTHRRGE